MVEAYYPSYYVIMAVRNNRDVIEDCLTCILEQSVKPKKVMILDDGSSDGTLEVLFKFANDFPEIIDIQWTNNETADYSRVPNNWNRCLQNGYDYHLIMAGDIVLEKDYVKKLFDFTKSRANIVVISGEIKDNTPAKTPQGAGRLVSEAFFRKYYPKGYPEIVGYESEILCRVIINGLESAVCSTAFMEHREKLGKSHSFYEWGYAMRALGYNKRFAIVRLVYDIFRNHAVGVKGSWHIFLGYFLFPVGKTPYYQNCPDDVRQYMRDLTNEQLSFRRIIRRRLSRLLNNQ